MKIIYFINKFESNNKNLKITVLNTLVLKAQLNNIDWRVFNLILINNSVIFATDSIISGD